MVAENKDRTKPWTEQQEPSAHKSMIPSAEIHLYYVVKWSACVPVSGKWPFLLPDKSLAVECDWVVLAESISTMMPLLSSTVVNCSDPGQVENGVRQSGLRYPEVFSYGVTVAIHCKRGFYLLGSAVLTCQHDGQWDRPIPRCLGAHLWARFLFSS